MAVILAYNLNPAEQAALEALCRRMDLRCRAVRTEEYALPVGALAGIPVAGTAAGRAGMFRDPMLVICGLPAPQLDALLQGLREPGMPRAALKAVLTPHNVTWDSARLHGELAREREAMRKKPD